MRGGDPQVRITRTLDSLELSKQRHEALVRKYQREITILTNEARRMKQLAGGEPDADIRPRIMHLLRKREVLRKQVLSLRARIENLFAHELTVEQSILIAEHVEVLRGVQNLHTPTVESVDTLMDACSRMTERVCEVSELLSEPQDIQWDEDQLEHELDTLLEDTPVEIPVEIPVDAPVEIPVAPVEIPVVPESSVSCERNPLSLAQT